MKAFDVDAGRVDGDTFAWDCGCQATATNGPRGMVVMPCSAEHEAPIERVVRDIAAEQGVPVDVVNHPTTN